MVPRLEAPASVEDRSVVGAGAPGRVVGSTPDAAPSPSAPPHRMDTASVPAGRLHVLDGLRFVGAAVVVFHHLVPHVGARWGDHPRPGLPGPMAWTVYGFLGVQLFFFISGFVILMTALAKDVPGFVASRAGRLLPAYWAAVLITGFVVRPGLRDDGNAPSLLDRLVNFTMVQDGIGARPVDGIYWTLWVELKFYVLIALLVAWGVTRRRLLVLCSVWPVVGAVVAHHGDRLLADLLIAPYAPFFAAGMVLYLAHREGWSTVLVGLSALNVALCLRQGAAAVRDIAPHVLVPVDPTVTMAVVACCWAVVALATTTSVARWHAPWLVWWGALSYPVYLMHETLGWRTIQWWSERLPGPAVVMVTWATIGACAAVIHYAVERPLGPWLRRAVDRGLRKP